MAEAAANQPDSAGARLAGARLRAGLTLEQVAEKLRLDRSTVVALEADDHRAIGAAVFVRGFLRRYAALVGEPAAEIEALYAKRPDAELQPDLSKTGMHRIEAAAHGPRLGLVPAVIAAVVLGIAGAVWWAMRTKPQPYTVVSEEHTQTLPATPAAAVAATPAAGAAGAASAAGAAAVPPAPAAAADAQPAPLPRRHLQLQFNGDCWVELYDARGYRLFFGFGHAGTTQELAGVPPFRFALGNAGALTVNLEGAPVALPETAPGARVRFLLNASGVVAGVR
jgi:cytoskeleton protein RodZ